MKSLGFKTFIFPLVAVLLLVGVTLARDNDNFIDDSFWTEYDALGTQGAKDALLIDALYGDGNIGSDTSTYTRYWNSNACDISSMSVVELSSQNLSSVSWQANTVYILIDDSYTVNGSNAQLQSCSAIISDATQATITSTSNNHLRLQIGNNIANNIELDSNNTTSYGFYVGVNSTASNIIQHDANLDGIALANYAYLHKSRAYNNTASDGIRAVGDHTIVEDTLLFNNRNGYYNNGAYNTINNSMFFNNTYYGIITYQDEEYFAVNNSLIFNNGDRGIYFSANGTIAEKAVLNNVIIFNHQGYGLYHNIGTTDLVVNNFYSYNNYFSLYQHPNFYGVMTCFLHDSTGCGNLSYLSTGSDLGWSDGSVVPQSMDELDYQWAVNINDFFPAFDPHLREDFTYDAIPDHIQYGNQILKQNQPVRYNTSGVLELSSLDYTPTEYITQSSLHAVDVIGSIYPKQNISTVYQANSIVTIGARTPTTYVLSGDFVGSPLSGTITTLYQDIPVQLTPGYGNKNIELIFPNTMGAPSSYITSFNYTSSSIDPLVAEYFSPGSSYTKLRTSNPCDLSTMSVVHKYDGENLSDIQSGTLYVLHEGTYVTSGGASVLECSALIGSGEVVLKPSGTTNYVIYMLGDNSILHNLKLDASGYFGGLSYTNGYRNNTSYIDLDIYNSTTLGIAIAGKSNYASRLNIYNNATDALHISRAEQCLFEYMNIYNNGGNAIYGNYAETHHNLISNSRIFNNADGIILRSTHHNSFSNLEIFNNGYSIYEYGGTSTYHSYNHIFSNILTYNNSNGILGGLYSRDHTFHNIVSFNNRSAQMSFNLASNTYYGVMATPNSVPVTALTVGTDGLNGWTNGSLNTGNDYQYVHMNIPVNEDGTPLIDVQDTFYNNQLEQSSRTANGNISFAYGDLVFPQTQSAEQTIPFDARKGVYASSNIIQLSSNANWTQNRPIGFDNFNLHSYLLARGYSTGVDGSYSGTYDVGLLWTDGEIQADLTIKTSVDNPEVAIGIPENTYVKKTNGDLYTGILSAPTTLSTGVASSLDTPEAVFSFGSDSQSLNFRDSGDQPVNLDVQQCSPELTIGQTYGVYYSTDGGSTYYSIGNYIAQDVNGQACITFQTDHATHFAIAGPGGEFSYDIYLSGHKNDVYTDVIVNQGEVYDLIIEYNNGTTQAVDPEPINIFGDIKKTDIQSGESGTLQLKIKPQKTFAPFWTVQ